MSKLQAELIADEMVRYVLAGAGLLLPLKIDGNEARIGVDLLAAPCRTPVSQRRVGVLPFRLVNSRMLLAWKFSTASLERGCHTDGKVTSLIDWLALHMINCRSAS
jgi:hypothetical protein